MSDLCLELEKKIFKKEIAPFHYINNMATPWPNNPASRVMKFIILVDHSLVITSIYLICLSLTDVGLGHRPRSFKCTIQCKYINTRIFVFVFRTTHIQTLIRRQSESCLLTCWHKIPLTRSSEVFNHKSNQSVIVGNPRLISSTT